MPTKNEHMLSYEEVSALLAYDETSPTGLRWKSKRPGAVKRGDPAGYVEPRGYTQVTINYVQYMAHRVVWLLKTGKWPDDEIDHKDHNPANNVFGNLRGANRAQNSRHQKIPKNNTSGCRCVYETSSGKWRVRISIGGKLRNFGIFSDKNQAMAVADKAYKNVTGEFGGLVVAEQRQ